MLLEELQPFEKPIKALYKEASDVNNDAEDTTINRDRLFGRLIFARHVTDPKNKPYRISLIRGNIFWCIDLETGTITRKNLAEN